jgi:hypothetical protein
MIAGFDLLECVDLEEAVEIAARTWRLSPGRTPGSYETSKRSVR